MVSLFKNGYIVAQIKPSSRPVKELLPNEPSISVPAGWLPIPSKEKMSVVISKFLSLVLSKKLGPVTSSESDFTV
jgi:hypothetical protein